MGSLNKKEIKMKLFETALISSVAAHSWIACVDYAEKNAAYYDHSKCRGWPRNAGRYAPIGGVFGGDTGYDTRPQSGTTPCASRRANGDYANGHHSAIYFKGQQVVMAHPMKNHGIGGCTNKYIPDNGNFIYQAPDNEVASFPKVGFQNAPAFCEDTDKALSTYSFNVPQDLEAGEYTFVWLWAFNSPQDYYSTCFDVEIVEDAAARQSKMSARGQNDFSLICDSTGTSTGEFGSMLGCDSLPDNGNNNSDNDADGSDGSNNNSDNAGSNNASDHDDGHDPATMGTVEVNQMTGKIYLPTAASEPTRREIHVVFYADCANVARPNFWFARMDYKTNDDGNILHRFRRSDGGSSEAIHYVLQQDDADDIRRGYIGFHWAFEGGCRLLQAPAVVHVTDIFQ